MEEVKKIPGDVAWIALALGIVGYDTIAVLSGKAETLSSAIWRSLSHPYKFPVAASIWFGLTWHLFGNPHARNSYRVHIVKIPKTKLRRKVK